VVRVGDLAVLGDAGVDENRNIRCMAEGEGGVYSRDTRGGGERERSITRIDENEIARERTLKVQR
jgi:hypothetical protein